jgi:hypothetical protein
MFFVCVCVVYLCVKIECVLVVVGRMGRRSGLVRCQCFQFSPVSPSSLPLSLNIIIIIILSISVFQSSSVYPPIFSRSPRSPSLSNHAPIPSSRPSVRPLLRTALFPPLDPCMRTALVSKTKKKFGEILNFVGSRGRV